MWVQMETHILSSGFFPVPVDFIESHVGNIALEGILPLPPMHRYYRHGPPWLVRFLLCLQVSLHWICCHYFGLDLVS